MARLKQLASRLGSLTPRVRSVGEGPDRLARRDREVPYRRWYKTARWRALRWECLTAASFTCARCNWFGGAKTSDLVADHVRPHRGERDAFFDPGNLQCLCRSCHDRDKQREERTARG